MTHSHTAHPEYRRDPVTGRWVIVAPERSLRPLALSHSKPHARRHAERDTCPFCAGSEDQTPGEVYSIRHREAPHDWSIRVVPNKFPAVRPVESFSGPSGEGLFSTVPGFGHHEVVIECSQHISDPIDLTDEQFTQVIIAYRERLIALGSDSRTAYVTIFKNVGAEAGASLAHTHSQLIATPVVPDSVRLELDGSADYYHRQGRNVFADILDREIKDRVRIVAETEHMIAFAPFAGRFAYELWILPRVASSRFESITNPAAADLALLLKSLLGKIDIVLGSPAYNYFVHTGPSRAGEMPHYRWHLEIMPRTARAAGFEWGSGCFINSVPPEQAAAELRQAQL